jgi:hypothetical protein
MNTNSASRASFLELYISLATALANKQGDVYPELCKYMNVARKIHGEDLTKLIVEWSEQGNQFAKEIRESDPTFVTDSTKCPQVFKNLCLDRIYARPGFSTKSKTHMWQYIHGLVFHANTFVADVTVIETCSEELPPPFDGTPPVGGIGFGEGSPEQIKIINDLARTLPSSVMSKMQALASGYQQGLQAGTMSPADLQMPNVLRDVVKTLDTKDVMDVIANLSSVVGHIQKAHEMPEIQALMRAMTTQTTAPEEGV